MRRPRTKIALACVVAMLVLAAFATWLMTERATLSPTEQQLVGTWRQTADDWGAAKMYVADYELRYDRTLHMSNTERATGRAVRLENAGHWRLKGDEIILYGKSKTGNGSWSGWLRSFFESDELAETKLHIDSQDSETLKLTTYPYDPRGNTPVPLHCTWERVTP